MKIFKRGLVLIAVLLALMVMVSCQSGSQEEQSEPIALTISAAASLKDALKEIEGLYVLENPEISLTLTFGPSGSLAEQIQQGAEVDVFLSASEKYMDDLNNAGEIDERTLKELLVNQVVLIVPQDSTTTISDFDQLMDPSITKIGIGEPKTVPAGQYALEVFTFYTIRDQILEKTVYAKDVKEVLTWVETGNIDAGIVYSTDAKISDGVKLIAIAPSASHKAIIYPTAMIKTSKNPEAARAFIEFLTSDAAKAVFEAYGFETL